MKLIHIIWMFILFSPFILVEKIDDLTSATAKLILYDRELAVVESCEERYFPKSRHTAAGFRYALVVRMKSNFSITGPFDESKNSCFSKIHKNVKVLINPSNPKEGLVYSYGGFFEQFILSIILLLGVIFSGIYAYLNFRKSP